MQLRDLPAVDSVLQRPELAGLLARHPHDFVAEAVRHVLDETRGKLVRGELGSTRALPAEPIAATLAREVVRRVVEDLPAGLVPVVNATGVVIHTNLGRALLAPEARAAMDAAAAGPCALEIDLDSGERGDRDDLVAGLLRELTGAEAALAVNNNAAALILAVDALARRREVVCSRGQLIEIGGSFRLPELLERSGASLREVGTTNRTTLADYESVLSRRTGMVLVAHPSNYRVVGFTTQPSLEELSETCRGRGIPLVVDLGSGALVDLSCFGLPHEPLVGETLRRGADLVTFSGDKLLGGPQAGIAVGCETIVQEMRRSPLRRALRLDKLRLAALQATLGLYRTARDLPAALPTLRLLTRPISELESLGARAVELLTMALPARTEVELIESRAEIGSGAQPARTLASRAIALRDPERGADELAALFRSARPAIIGRRARGRLILDLRAVERAEDLVPRSAEPGATGAGSSRASDEVPA